MAEAIEDELIGSPLVWDSGKKYEGAAWPVRLIAVLGGLLCAPMAVAVAVEDAQRLMSLYGLVISFTILFFIWMLLAGLFWRQVSVQSVSLSSDGIHVVAWLSKRIGLPWSRQERTIALSNIQEVKVLNLDGMDSLETGTRVVPIQRVDGLKKYLDIDFGSEDKAAAFVTAVREIRAHAVEAAPL